VPLSQLAHVEANLQGIASRVPQLPLAEIMICRVALILGRDLTSGLDQMLRPAGLTEPEFRVLMALFAHEGSSSPTELCGALAQSPANLTRIGDSLVKRGLVSRSNDATDRRRMHLVLRPAGEQLLQSLLPQMCNGVHAVFAAFTPSEKAQLLAGMKKLLEGIDAISAQGVSVLGGSAEARIA